MFAIKTDTWRKQSTSLHHITLHPSSFRSDCFPVLKINIVCDKRVKEIPRQTMKECYTSKNDLSSGKKKRKKDQLFCHLLAVDTFDTVTDTVARCRYLNLYYQSLIIMSRSWTNLSSPRIKRSLQLFLDCFSMFFLKTDTSISTHRKGKLTASIK